MRSRPPASRLCCVVVRQPLSNLQLNAYIHCEQHTWALTSPTATMRLLDSRPFVRSADCTWSVHAYARVSSGAAKAVLLVSNAHNAAPHLEC